MKLIHICNVYTCPDCNGAGCSRCYETGWIEIDVNENSEEVGEHVPPQCEHCREEYKKCLS